MPGVVTRNHAEPPSRPRLSALSDRVNSVVHWCVPMLRHAGVAAVEAASDDTGPLRRASNLSAIR